MSEIDFDEWDAERTQEAYHEQELKERMRYEYALAQLANDEDRTALVLADALQNIPIFEHRQLLVRLEREDDIAVGRWVRLLLIDYVLNEGDDDAY